ncbi:ATP-dependent helicase [Parapedomonas caeni]
MSSLTTPDHADPPYIASLNAPQREAVLTTDGPVLVLAGAGTGKTSALTARLAHLVATGRAWPGEILAVTFTNKAAREMQHRVGQLIGGAVEGMPWLGTFHAVAARILRRHAELVGLKSNFTILDTDDQIRLIKQIIQAEGIDEKRWPPRVFAGIIDRWKNRGWTPEKLPEAEKGVFADGQGGDLYAAYQERLKTLNACDFGDLLLHTLTIFSQHADVLADYQRRFKYILVDEYQDTNVSQYLWLRLLAQARKNICCVGDDDQSIYSWRGAEVGNILRFEQDFPGAKVIRLEQNYRSTPHILGAASGLITANQGRLGKTLWTDAREAGEKVHVISVWDGADEARTVGERIERAQGRGQRLRDFAILVRASFQTREFEDRFITLGLPYKIIGGFRFYERAEIRDAMAYLRVLMQPDDDLAFERIVNLPKRGLGDKTLQKVHLLARAQGIPMTRAAQAMVETDELPPGARKTLGNLLADFDRWRAELPHLPHAELARLVLEESGYVAMWQADRSPEAAGRLENLNELTRAIEEFENLSAFLDHVSLVMDNEANDDHDKVTMMTLHAAKGLEFDSVFLAGWEEGVFPNQRSLDEGGTASLEEERRLAYVGITRARRVATILHAANRRVYGQWQSCIPSRFLSELPAEHVDHESTLSGGATPNWRWTVTPHDGDPFGVAGRGEGRGPGWGRAAAALGAGLAGAAGAGRPGDSLGARRAAAGGRRGTLIEGRATSRSVSSPVSAIPVGARVFHDKFGYGAVIEVDGNKLEIEFELSGRKRVVDSFVSLA